MTIELLYTGIRATTEAIRLDPTYGIRLLQSWFYVAKKATTPRRLGIAVTRSDSAPDLASTAYAGRVVAYVNQRLFAWQLHPTCAHFPYCNKVQVLAFYDWKCGNGIFGRYSLDGSNGVQSKLEQKK